MIPSTATEWVVGNGQYNEVNRTQLRLRSMIRLKQIVIGDNCFGKVRVVELDGLIELESVVIGQKSFMISDNERSDGSCRIVNCPNLKSLRIGGTSFQEYHSFELNNLPSLQSIDIGEYCFYYAPSFSLIGLIDWLVWIHRSSSITISQTWWCCIQSSSFGCVWEWLNG